MLPLLLLFQLSADPTVGDSVSLPPLLSRAEAAVRAASLAPGGWLATMETEVATLGRREGRIEGATLLEQTSSAARWSSSGGFEQHVVGSRSFPNAIPLSRLSLLQIGWCVPSLYGERLLMITRTGPRNLGYAETMRGPQAPEVIVHPLASDRDRYYRFDGTGRPTRMRLPGWSSDRDFYRIEVSPREDLDREETLFEGEMYVDVATLLPARLFGRFRTLGPVSRGGMFGFGPSMFTPTMTMVDLVNQLVPGVGWVPLSQRFEIESVSSRAVGYGGARRVMTRFHEVRPIEPEGSGPVAIGASTFGYILTAAPRDSLREFRRWFDEAGTATRSASSRDFQRFRRDRLQPTGRPILVLEGGRGTDFFRVNKVEGPFTGAALTLKFRDAAPGLEVMGKGGWAWSEQTVRGAVAVAWRRPRHAFEFSGGRFLDPTNKFRNQFEEPSVDGLFSRDDWDYVDRWAGGVAGTWTLASDRGSIVRADLGWARDQAASRHMESSILGAELRPNRGIREGNYVRTRLLLDWNPDVSPVFARDGLGARVEIERGDGDLDFTRVEARLVARKTFARVFVMSRLHLGSVFSDAPPPQQLFELGGPAGLPGYEYKEFAGDRAALLRFRASLPLMFLDLPLRIGSWLDLASLSPAISFGVQSAVIDASDANARDAVRALGDRYDEATGEPLVTASGEPLPASVASGQLHTSVDLRVGFFGDALGFGVARALESGRRRQFFAVFGRQF